VKYVFSDKTGTLTQNVMEFKKFSAGPVSYGTSNPGPIDYAPGVTNVNFECPLFEAAWTNAAKPDRYLQDFIRILAVCHTIIVDEKDG
jgi:magnesium-transporting ATPase (P-type)